MLIVVGIATLLLILWCYSPQTSDKYVVVLSLDGFRYDYPRLARTPTLDSIARYGVAAEGFIPCFPSKTFPNHYSMATGLYPDNHGIIDNRFWDSELGIYSTSSRKDVENEKFYGGEPFWVTAEKQGILSATYFWVGSEAPIQGIRPSYWKTYQENISFEARIDTVIHWLTLPTKKRPKLIAVYYHQPDEAAHNFGATASETFSVVSKLDSLIGVFIQRLNQLPIARQINFIVVSDHGMADISPQKYINLSELIDTSNIALVTGGSPILNLSTVKGYEDSILKQLQTVPNIKAWHRNQIPDRIHFGKNKRVLPILIAADLGYNVGFDTISQKYTGGTHGYDNIYPEMWGIFYAIGPAFRKNYLNPPLLNLNLYNIIIRSIGLKPAPNDGKISEIDSLFNPN